MHTFYIEMQGKQNNTDNGAEKKKSAAQVEKRLNHVLYSSLCHANLTGRACIAVISVKIH
jgi:hypothetical protein